MCVPDIPLRFNVARKILLRSVEYNRMQSPNPTVSVIIPTYNRIEYVPKAIESVLRQTFTDYELIVVDDGSTDGTKDALQKYAHAIHYIYQTNSGVSLARNAGIRQARGKWLAFLDSDDEWGENYLITQIAKAKQHPDLCMQTADCRITESDGSSQCYYEINGSLPEFRGADYLHIEKPFHFVVQHGPWQIGSTIILRDALMKAGMFDTSLKISEDYDLMARVALQGPFGMIREELMNVLRRRESITCLTQQARENPIRTRESDERIYQKLRKIETLNSEERTAVAEIMRANRSAIGNLFLESGQLKKARECYRRAFLIRPTVRSLGKYVLSFLPAKCVLRIIQQ
jgi:glycosyltransferase involved in cell wall biosynthesis